MQIIRTKMETSKRAVDDGMTLTSDTHQMTI